MNPQERSSPHPFLPCAYSFSSPHPMSLGSSRGPTGLKSVSLSYRMLFPGCIPSAPCRTSLGEKDESVLSTEESRCVLSLSHRQAEQPPGGSTLLQKVGVCGFFFAKYSSKRKRRKIKSSIFSLLTGFNQTHPDGLPVGSSRSATKAWSTHEWRPCCEHVIVLLVPCYCSICAIVPSVKQQHSTKAVQGP